MNKEYIKTFLAGIGGAYVVSEVIKEIKNYRKTHKGTKRILYAGVWEDEEGNIYNCHGEKIGKVIWEKGFGG